MIQSNTNWNLYKTFAVVYETRNLHKASEILGTTRSAISQNIKELGNQLGFTLFTPHSKGVEPTENATKIYPQIKTAIDAIITAEDLSRTVSRENQNVIKIAMSASIAEYYVRNYLKVFYKKYPNIRLEIHERGSTSLDEQKKLDLIIDVDVAWEDCFTIIPLKEVFVGFYATKDFMNAHKITNKISREKFLALPIIIRGIVWRTIKSFNNITENPNVTITSSVYQTISIVKDSLGIGIFAKEYIPLLNEKELVEITVEGISFPECLIACGHSNPLSKNAQTFIDGLREFMLISKP